MKRIELSLKELEFQFEVSNTKLKRHLLAAGVPFGPGKKISLSDAHNSLLAEFGGKRRLDAAKLKTAEEEARLKELSRKEIEGRLVDVDEAIPMILTPFNAITQMIKDMPARLAPQCNPSDPIHARGVLVDYSRLVATKFQETCSKLSRKG
tara:strand:+ start:3223 stop:3675 length:453 start_codon:yes stop_codon:yes gene_type:complete